MTMVGASSGAGPIMRYSRSAAPMRKVPVGERVMPTPDRCRPCESRDPYSAASPSGPMADALRQSESRWLWVPAFAGTTLGVFLPLPQLEALGLPGGGFRQALDDFGPARIFPGADLLLDVLLQRVIQAIGVRIRPQHHERLRLQQSFGV